MMLVILLSCLLHGAADTLWTPQLAVQRVLQVYPSLEASRQALQIARLQVEEARTGYWPSLQLSGTYVRQDPVPEFPLGTERFAVQPHNLYNGGLEASYVLLDFGRRAAQEHLAQTQVQQQEAALETQRQTLMLQTLAHLYRIRLLDEQLQVQEQTIAALQTARRMAQARQAAGTATELDVRLAETRLAEATSRYIQLRSEKHQQILAIRQLLQLVPDTTLALQATIVPLDTFPSLEQLLSWTYQRHPALQELAAAEAGVQFQIQYLQAQYRPLLHVGATAGIRNGYPLDLNKPHFNTALQLQLQLPLFDGGARALRLEEARTRLNQIRTRQQETRQTLATRLRQQYTELQALNAQLQEARLQLEHAQLAVDFARTHYRNGTATIMELLEAEVRLAQARLQLHSLQYALLMQQCTLLQLAGVLPEYLGKLP
ncbi:TolC family protein [Rhodothermus marinus]|uniref:TolC family protein n=1 Tax=Rhodothermus marinus TaxID=29549 RepID=UPI0012BA4396|nr:TolC family protein [Rhodothermus marinus]BBM71071.1 hypothetical protein RmaAA213_29170 [Rhodothermus marinus]